MMKKVIDTTIKLNNGVEMPVLGYGTYKITDPVKGHDAMVHAINYGYHMIDTADIYKNHEIVRQAIMDSNKTREDLFITSKIWMVNQNPAKVLVDFDRFLTELGTDYIDLLLLHWPDHKNIELYQAIEKIYTSGKVKAIGVSNFMLEHLEELLANTTIVPAVNQVELHPQLPLLDLVKFCQKHGIVVESWQTIMKGEVEQIELIAQLAKKYHVDGPAIALRWAFQHNIIVIPKSETLARIESNASLIDNFVLTKDEMDAIDQLGPEKRLGTSPYKIYEES